MTLLTAVFAAVITTAVWYRRLPDDTMYFGRLSLIFWGASLMWFIDAVFEYIGSGSDFFTPSPADMLNDLYLGLSVVALGLVIWVAMLLIKDPKNVLKKFLIK